MNIVFNNLGIHFKFEESELARKVIKHILKEEEKKLGEISIIFTNNHHIFSINRTYLKHSYYTDVITFNNSMKHVLSGDIFVSLDQVILNAKSYRTSSMEELFRVIIHGVLHLVGYVDENENDKRRMRVKEDHFLKIVRKHTLSNLDELVL